MNTDKLRKTFASRIRKLRDGKYNQGEFADSVGISRGAMSYYEQESRTPDIGVLRAICVKHNISADYLLGIIPDANHAVSDVCRETGLSPDAVRRLNIIQKLITNDFQSNKSFSEAFPDDSDIIDALNLATATSVPELLNILIENNEGISLLTLLGVIILGAEIHTEDGIQPKPMIKVKSASKNFEVTIPIENLTSAFWVNIQEDANLLKRKLEEEIDLTKTDK